MPRNNLTPSERVLRAKIAANTRWARTPDRAAATAPGRAAALSRFERQVDPDGTMDPVVRAKLAGNAKRAFYQEMAWRSHRARRAGRTSAPAGEVA